MDRNHHTLDVVTSQRLKVLTEKISSTMECDQLPDHTQSRGIPAANSSVGIGSLALFISYRVISGHAVIRARSITSTHRHR